MPTRRQFLASATVALTGGFRPPLAKSADLSVTGLHNPDLKPFDDLLTRFLADNAVPGAAVAVTRNGKLAYARGFGYADIDVAKPVAPDSTFRIASVSKPITAVGVMMLVEQGKLKLDAPVLNYIRFRPHIAPGEKTDERWAKVTVRQCLQHTGGWDRGKKGGFDPIATPWQIMEAMRLTHAPTPDDVVEYMMGKPLDFDPGERDAYSNLGYLVLSRVMEAVTGQKYEPWMQKNVLSPVKATGMYLGRGLPADCPKHEVRYYDSRKRKGKCLYPPKQGQDVPGPDGAWNVEGFEAHGGWVSSAIDLVRFACAFDYGKKSPLLSADSIKEMWARPVGLAGADAKGKPRDSFYGCGWQVRPIEGDGRANTWHNGLIPGTSTLLVRRSDGLNWAVLFNTEANATGKVLSGLIDGPMHVAANAVKSWPDADLFEKF